MELASPRAMELAEPSRPLIAPPRLMRVSSKRIGWSTMKNVLEANIPDLEERGFDIVLAFPPGDAPPEQSPFARRLESCGFELHSGAERHIHLRIRSVEGMAELAERVQLKKRLPGRDVYVAFTRDQAAAGFFASSSPQRLFTSAERIQLCLTKLQQSERHGGAGANLDALVAHGELSEWWVLHDEAELATLRALWAQRAGDDVRGVLHWAWRRLLGDEIVDEEFADALHDYYGPRQAVYFAYLTLYTQWLRYPAALGMLLTIYSAAVQAIDLVIADLFGLLVVVWAIRFLKEWRRTETELSTRWSVEHVADVELERPSYARATLHHNAPPPTVIGSC